MPQQVIMKHGGKILEEHYGKSLVCALISIFPEYKWTIWRFHDIQPTFWTSLRNQRLYLSQVAEELKLQDLKDWCNVSVTELYRRKGYHLINDIYDGSLWKTLSAVYPEYKKWKIWMFETQNVQYWQDSRIQRDYFDWLQTVLAIYTQEQWYQITPHDVHAQGGFPLLNKFYKGSVINALRAVYPQQVWLDALPHEYWADIKQQYTYLTQVGIRIGVQHMQDWYNVKSYQLHERGAAGLLACYDGQVPNMLRALFPQVTWELKKFQEISVRFWFDSSNRRQLAKELDIFTASGCSYCCCDRYLFFLCKSPGILSGDKNATTVLGFHTKPIEVHA